MEGMATAHIWFLNPWRGGLSGVAPSEPGGTGPRAGTQPRPGPTGPGTQGKRDSWLPGKGQGLAVPEVPSFRYMDLETPKVQPLPDKHTQREGGAQAPHACLLGGPMDGLHLASV